MTPDQKAILALTKRVAELEARLSGTEQPTIVALLAKLRELEAERELAAHDHSEPEAAKPLPGTPCYHCWARDKTLILRGAVWFCTECSPPETHSSANTMKDKPFQFRRPDSMTQWELVKIDSDDTIQIGSPATSERFKMRIYIGGELLEPDGSCVCGACELLRTLPKPASNGG